MKTRRSGAGRFVFFAPDQRCTYRIRTFARAWPGIGGGLSQDVDVEK
jgi:hypothetical protein